MSKKTRDKFIYEEGDLRVVRAGETEEKSLSTGAMVSWNSSGGRARGKIVSIHREGTVPDIPVKITASEDEPAARIQIYRDGEPTDVYVGHKLSTLTEGKAGGADRNRGGAEHLRRYWLTGEGAAKIRWGTSGDFTRCVRLLRKHMPSQAKGRTAEGYCANRHKEANGFWPGDKRNKSADLEGPEDFEEFDWDAVRAAGEHMTANGLDDWDPPEIAMKDIGIGAPGMDPDMTAAMAVNAYRDMTGRYSGYDEETAAVRTGVKALATYLGDDAELHLGAGLFPEEAGAMAALMVKNAGAPDAAVEQARAAVTLLQGAVERVIFGESEQKHDAPWTPEYHPGKHTDDRWKKPKGDKREALSVGETAKRRGTTPDAVRSGGEGEAQPASRGNAFAPDDMDGFMAAIEGGEADRGRGTSKRRFEVRRDGAASETFDTVQEALTFAQQNGGLLQASDRNGDNVYVDVPAPDPSAEVSRLSKWSSDRDAVAASAGVEMDDETFERQYGTLRELLDRANDAMMEGNDRAVARALEAIYGETDFEIPRNGAPSA